MGNREPYERQGGQPQPGWSQPPQQPGWSQPQQQAYSGAGRPARVGSGAEGIRPLNLGDVLDGMFRLFISHWRAYVLALGVVVVPLSLVNAYLGQQQTGGRGLLELFTNPQAAEALVAGGGASPWELAGTGIAGLVGLLVAPLLTGAAVMIASEGYLGRDPQAGAALGTAARRYFALVGTYILTFFAIVAVFIPTGVLIAVALATDGNVAVIVAAVLVFLATLVAAFAVGFLLSLADITVVTEGLGPAAALRRSWRLVRRRFWPVVGYSILAGLIAGIIGGVLALLLSFPGQLFAGVLGYVLLAAGSILSSIIARPLATNAQTLIYYDVRVRSEGLDLHLMADAMQEGGQGATGWAGAG